jgi:hypothetical protein
MSAHDPVKAAAEELSGMQECWKILGVLARDAERVMTEAEARYNAMVKLRGFLAGRIDEQQSKVNALRQAAEQQPEGSQS